MILGGFLLFLLINKVLCHVELESEDYYFPLEPVINYCKLSDECQHDFVPLCGQNSLGLTRLFKDDCDLYEYNCDEKQTFHHVKYEICPQNEDEPEEPTKTK